LPYFQVPSTAALSQLTFDNYINIGSVTTLEPFLNTAILMVVVPTATLLLSIPVSWVVVRTRYRIRGFLDTLAFLPHATPHILLAVSLAYLALVYRSIFPVYNTIWIIAFAQIIAYTAYCTRTINSAMIQIHQELEEAGRISGGTNFVVICQVIVPLVAPAMLNAWIWVMILSYREVTMALTLQGPGNQVVPTLLWELWLQSNMCATAAVGTLIILFMAALVFVLRILFRNKLAI